MNLVRHRNNEDARRELAVELFKKHAHESRPESDYTADIEWLEHAIVAFGDEWANKDLAPAPTGEVWLLWITHKDPPHGLLIGAFASEEAALAAGPDTPNLQVPASTFIGEIDRTVQKLTVIS